MNSNYEFLIEKEEIWARMAMQVLEDNGIPCAALPVYGAGLVIKTGKKEIFRLFVPFGKKKQASELMQELFSEELPEEYKQTDV